MNSLIDGVFYIYGTSAQRTALKASDFPDPIRRVVFKEGGGSDYEWDFEADGWNQISVNGAARTILGSSGGANSVTEVGSITATGSGNAVTQDGSRGTWQASITGTTSGANSFTVLVEVSVDGVNWLPGLTLSDSDVSGSLASDAAAIEQDYPYSRAYASELTLGGGTNVTIYRGQ